MKIYIVIKLRKDDSPQIIGCFLKRTEAEQMAYATPWKNGEWVNILEEVLN